MSDSDLQRKPHHVDKDFWWYEESDGVHVVFDTFNQMGFKVQVVKRITWRALRAALKRKDK